QREQARAFEELRPADMMPRLVGDLFLASARRRHAAQAFLGMVQRLEHEFVCLVAVARVALDDLGQLRVERAHGFLDPRGVRISSADTAIRRPSSNSTRTLRARISCASTRPWPFAVSTRLPTAGSSRWNSS